MTDTSLLAAQTSRGAATILGLIILAGIVLGFVALGISNARTATKRAAADAEVRRLRAELAALRATAPAPAGAAASRSAPDLGPAPLDVHEAPLSAEGYPLIVPVAADWYPDPRGAYQYRYWDGSSWTPYVSSGGAVWREA